MGKEMQAAEENAHIFTSGRYKDMCSCSHTRICEQSKNKKGLLLLEIKKKKVIAKIKIQFKILEIKLR